MKNRKEILYMLFCVLNIYIAALLLYHFDEGTYNFKKYAVEILSGISFMSRHWLCSIGVLIHILGTAVYEFFASKKRRSREDTALWISVLTSVPMFLISICPIISGEGDRYIAAQMILLPAAAGAGIWLGRLLAGRYKGVKQFYLPDILYIAVCVVLSAAVCIGLGTESGNCEFENSDTFILGYTLFETEDFERFCLYVIVGVFISGILYSLFSEFEYVQERLVRAIMAAFIIFMPVSVFMYIKNYDSLLWNFMYELPFAQTIAVFAALCGVLVGYYIRILRVGGDEDFDKRKRLIKTAVTFVVIAVVFCAFEWRFFLMPKVNVWESMKVDENAIVQIEVSDEGTYDGKIYFTRDPECIQKIVDYIKTQRGVSVINLPNKEDSDCYTVTAYDKDYEEVFCISSYCKGEIWAVGKVGVYSSNKIVLPKQYYGMENTAKESYYDLVTSGRPMTKEEKLGYIKNNVIWPPTYGVWSNLIADDDRDIRLAVVGKIAENKADETERYTGLSYEEECLLEQMMHDEDIAVRKMVYGLIGGDGYMDVSGAELYEAAITENDPKLRFYAVNNWIDYVISENYEYNKIRAEEYVRGRFNAYVNDIDKLPYACALVKLDQGFYYRYVKEYLETLPDDEYGDIKAAVREMFSLPEWRETESGSLVRTSAETDFEPEEQTNEPAEQTNEPEEQTNVYVGGTMTQNIAGADIRLYESEK
ncbi:MAG: HEAT repeat domain-containing protein [Firmicutes bacterium]|nr:HEAT repeat domain-containing protein [Bacillota bacterium]